MTSRKTKYDSDLSLGLSAHPKTQRLRVNAPTPLSPLQQSSPTLNDFFHLTSSEQDRSNVVVLTDQSLTQRDLRSERLALAKDLEEQEVDLFGGFIRKSLGLNKLS